MKWSLRTFFIAISLIAIFLAWKFNERNCLISATRRVREAGGEVSYCWQEPNVGFVTKVFLGAYMARPIVTSVQLPDGTIEKKSWTQHWKMPCQLSVIEHGSKSKPRLGSFAAIWRDNDDVRVEAVRVDADDVTQEFVDAIGQLRGLRVLQIRRAREYYRVQVCNVRHNEVEQECLDARIEELNEPFSRASILIKRELPEVQVVDGVVGQ